MERKTAAMMGLSLLLMAILLTLIWSKNQSEQQDDALLRLKADPECDLHSGACHVDLPDGASLTLSITPGPIPLVKPLTIKVISHSVLPEKVMVDFKGVSMEMGPNHVVLNAVENGVYEAKGMLPVCIQSRMHWRADVYIQTADKTIVAGFPFITSR
jgi:hypothetical protein